MSEPMNKNEEWGRVFQELRPQLLRLAHRNLSPMLARRVSEEDVVQTAMEAASKRIPYLEANPEIPLYFKLRNLLLQTVTDLERFHLRSQKRDAFLEVEMPDAPGTQTEAMLSWNMLADSISSPSSHIRKEERESLLHQALDALSDNDKCILQMRHFDGLSNQECAEILHIDQKAASIRYVRALQRLKEKLMEYSEFRP